MKPGRGRVRAIDAVFACLTDRTKGLLGLLVAALAGIATIES